MPLYWSLGPGILEFIQLKALIFQARDVRADTLSVPSLIVLKGVPDRIRNKRNSFSGERLDSFIVIVDFLFDAITVFQTVLETDQVPIWILTLRGAQRWRDLFLLSVCDTVALSFNPFVVGGFQELGCRRRARIRVRPWIGLRAGAPRGAIFVCTRSTSSGIVRPSPPSSISPGLAGDSRSAPLPWDGLLVRRAPLARFALLAWSGLLVRTGRLVRFALVWRRRRGGRRSTPRGTGSRLGRGQPDDPSACLAARRRHRDGRFPPDLITASIAHRDQTITIGSLPD